MTEARPLAARSPRLAPTRQRWRRLALLRLEGDGREPLDLLLALLAVDPFEHIVDGAPGDERVMLAEGGVGVDDLPERGPCLHERDEDPQSPSGRPALAVRGRDRCLGEVLERDAEEEPGFLDTRTRGVVGRDTGEQTVDKFHGRIVPARGASA